MRDLNPQPAEKRTALSGTWQNLTDMGSDLGKPPARPVAPWLCLAPFSVHWHGIKHGNYGAVAAMCARARWHASGRSVGQNDGESLAPRPRDAGNGLGTIAEVGWSGRRKRARRRCAERGRWDQRRGTPARTTPDGVCWVEVPPGRRHRSSRTRTPRGHTDDGGDGVAGHEAALLKGQRRGRTAVEVAEPRPVVLREEAHFLEPGI